MNPIEESQLVCAARGGDRDAFASLVAEHQQMACALAYARTGSFAASEEIAQEAFLAAWKQMALEPPRNFRAWLCGTIRHLAARFHRGAARFEGLAVDVADGAPGPDEVADAREEEALVWASLEQLAEIYREPLVLYYRQDRSIREVATALDLSEETVRQRLSRGRGLLRDTVQEKVESALARSAPGPAFTLAVLAAVPALSSTAQAAGTGLALAKGTGAVAMTGLSGVLGGMFAGLAGAWFGMKCSLDHAESARERRFIVGVAWWTAGTIVVFMAALMALLLWGRPLLATRPTLWIALMAADILLFTAMGLGFGILNNRALLRIRAEERVKRGADAAETADCSFEYRSRGEFLGLPLLHVRLGGSPASVAKGWIAYGNIAVAPLLAFGGIAVGGISLGGVSIGIFTLGGIGIGLFSFSGLAIGGVVMGGIALGWIAIGGAAWGALAAFGGQAWAGLYGLGRHVSAPHANDAAAKAFFHDHGLMQVAGWIADHGWWAQAAVFGPILLGLLWIRRLRRQQKLRNVALLLAASIFGLSCAPKKEEQKSMDFAVKTVPETLFFCVDEAVTQAEIPDFAMRAIGPLYEALGKAGQHPAGDLQFLCPQWNGPEGKSKLVIGIPVASEFPAKAPAYFWKAPAYRCLWTEYVGPMSGIKDAWAQLGAAVEKSEHRCAGSWREVYVHWVAPESAENRTELQSGIE